MNELTGTVSTFTSPGLFFLPVLPNNQKDCEQQAAGAGPCSVSSVTESGSVHF